MWSIPLFAGLVAAMFPKGVQAAVQKTKEIFGPFLIFGPPTKSQIDSLALAKAKQKVMNAEGRRNDVYRDSRGKLTVGIGHLVIPADGLNYGDTITDERINKFFEDDIQEAFASAKNQAIDLGKYTPEFIAALTSVNFQLGTGWTRTFANTYNDLKNDNYESAITRLEQSAWRQQTPVRVAEFIDAIQRAYA